MPADFDTGFTYRVPAWHRMATVLEERPSSFDEARRLAGLDWEVETGPLFFQSSEGVQVLDGWQRLSRDDRPDETLSVQPESYTVISTGEIGHIVEFVLDNVTGTKWETLGSVKGGRMVFATVLLDRPWQVSGDNSPILPYFNLTTRHDGRGGVSLGASSVRQVCANTILASEMEMKRLRSGMQIRHTSNWADKLVEMRDRVQMATKDLNQQRVLFEALGAKRARTNDVEHFLDAWIPLSSDMTPRVTDNTMQNRRTFRSILSSDTNQSISHNWWGVLSAAVEFSDHFTNSRSDDTEVDRILSGDVRKVKAVQTVRKLARV